MRNDMFEPKWSGQTNDFYLVSGNLSCSPHLHKNIEIIYNLFGEKNIVINSKPFTLAAGQLAVSLAYDIHQYSFSENSVQLVLIIPDAYASAFYSFMGKNKLSDNIITDGNKKIMFYLEKLKEEKEKSTPNALITEGLMKCILGEIAGKIELKEGGNIQDTKNFMQQVFEYIEANYKKPIALESIATHFGYNKFYFSRLFNSSFSININEYIAIIRLSHAMDYMKKNKCTVTAAALDNGFGSVKTFYKYYKKFKNDI